MYFTGDWYTSESVNLYDIDKLNFYYTDSWSFGCCFFSTALAVSHLVKATKVFYCHRQDEGKETVMSHNNRQML